MDTSSFLDWAVTGMFYEGVHWVEAYLAKSSFHSVNHGSRMMYMRHDTMLNAISKDMERLKFDSENARYQCYKFTKKDISGDIIPRVDQIKNLVEPII